MRSCFPGQDEGGSLPSEAGRCYSRKDWQEGHRGGLKTSRYDVEGVVNRHIYLSRMGASGPDWGAVFCRREDKGLGGCT